MDNELKVFSIEEANQLIPVLRELIHQLKEKQDQAVHVEAQIDALEIVGGTDNPKSKKEVDSLVKKHQDIVTDFYEIIDKIQSFGCLLKDLEMGLVDFYSVMDGKVVYLCWKLDEHKINHWHEIGKGFMYRQPLDVRPGDFHIED